MDSAVIVGILSLLGTLGGSALGIMAANKLTLYRIAELEKKVDKHNTLIERTAVLERDNKTAFNRIDELRGQVEHLREG